MQSGRASFNRSYDKLVNFYVRRSVALGLLSWNMRMFRFENWPKQLGIYDDCLISVEKLAAGIHSVGAPAIVQISHAGAVATQKL